MGSVAVVAFCGGGRRRAADGDSIRQKIAGYVDIVRAYEVEYWYIEYNNIMATIKLWYGTYYIHYYRMLYPCHLHRISLSLSLFSFILFARFTLIARTRIAHRLSHSDQVP